MTDVAICKYNMVTWVQFLTDKAKLKIFKLPNKAINHVFVSQGKPTLEFLHDAKMADIKDMVVELGLTYEVYDFKDDRFK